MALNERVGGEFLSVNEVRGGVRSTKDGSKTV